LKWDLEPVWFRCPYVVPIAGRHLEITASRVEPWEPPAAAAHSRQLLERVKQQDWFRCPDRPKYMSVAQNVFVTDVTMTGTLFQLWDAVRLNPTASGVYVLLRYLDTIIHDDLQFEERPFYERLFLDLVKNSKDAELHSYADTIRRTSHRQEVMTVRIEAETRDYNIVAIETSSGHTPVTIRYCALAKALGPLSPMRERLCERDVPPMVLVADSIDEARRRVEAVEWPDVELIRSMRGYNILKTGKGWVALAQSLGQIDCFIDRIGDRDLPPVVLCAATEEELQAKLARY